MGIGEKIKEFFGGKKNSAQVASPGESEEALRTKIAGLDQDETALKQIMNTTDSEASSRTADAERLAKIRGLRDELVAKLPQQEPTPQTAGQVEVGTVMLLMKFRW